MDDLLSEVNESQSRDMTWWGCPHSTRATASCHQGQDFAKPLFLSLVLPFFFFLGYLDSMRWWAEADALSCLNVAFEHWYHAL